MVITNQVSHVDLLSDVSLARGLVFLQRAAALRDLTANATLAIKIAAIFSRSTNTEVSDRKIFRANRAVLDTGRELFVWVHIRTPLGGTTLRATTFLENTSPWSG